MKLHAHFNLNRVAEDHLRDRRVVVIDVLRAGTSIATAIANGCREIIPADSIGTATSLATDIGRKSILLCGEREGRRIDGFDLGNSPAEYTRDVVRDKNLVFVTTNGSVALVKSRFASLTVVCAFVNVSAVLDYLVHGQGDIHILCSGSQGLFALEDVVCGGMLVAGLRSRLESPLELNDSAVAAELLLKHYARQIETLLRDCDHGRYLTEIGFAGDVQFCSEVDALRVVPVMRNGRISRPANNSPQDHRA